MEETYGYKVKLQGESWYNPVVNLTPGDGYWIVGYIDLDGETKYIASTLCADVTSLIPRQSANEIRGFTLAVDSKEEKVEKQVDMVNDPPHYKKGKYEAIDIIEDVLTPEEFKGYLKGTMLKYIIRAKHKGNETQDYGKAEFYTKRLARIED